MGPVLAEQVVEGEIVGLAQAEQIMEDENRGLVQAEQVGKKREDHGQADNLDCDVRNGNSTASIINLNRAAELSVLVGQLVLYVWSFREFSVGIIRVDLVW